MSGEAFLARWSRLKMQPQVAPAAVPSESLPVTDVPVEAAPEPIPPTLADAAALTADADFSAFVGRNVDAAVRRLAMKKLFADPHFQGHDGLDIYMDDFTLASPMPSSMLEQLAHTKQLFASLGEALDALEGAAGLAAAPELPELPAPAEDDPDAPDRNAA